MELKIGPTKKIDLSIPWRIDIHHHIIPQAYRYALAKMGIVQSFGVAIPPWDADETLAFMNRKKIETVIFSISSPGIFFGDPEQTASLARQLNETMADVVASHPDRFGAFAALPLPDPDASLKELEYALDTLKLDGVALLSNVDGRYLGDPAYNELFDELNRRDAVIFIHPEVPPGYAVGSYNLPPVLIDVPYDTTRAIVKLIFTGTMARCPRIRFIAAHAGGTAPFLAFRITLGEYHKDYRAMLEQVAPEGIITYLKRLYYDTALSASPFALRCLGELVDTSHIIFGSDYPFAQEDITEISIDQLESFERFQEKDLLTIERANALSLFPRLKT